jgi:hypothetical protein
MDTGVKVESQPHVVDISYLDIFIRLCLSVGVGGTQSLPCFCCQPALMSASCNRLATRNGTTSGRYEDVHVGVRRQLLDTTRGKLFYSGQLTLLAWLLLEIALVHVTVSPERIRLF